MRLFRYASYLPLARDLKARQLARGAKRLDLCAAQVAHVLHGCGFAGAAPIRGKHVLELGTGWVMTHSAVFHLLGAERITSTDLFPLARPAALATAIRASEPSIVRDVLSPFEDHPALRARLQRLSAVERFDAAELDRSLHLTYRAPVDLVRQAVPTDRPVDVAFSWVSLEYVAVNELPALFEHLAGALAPGGWMYHFLHLEDHGEGKGPFDHLAEPGDAFGPDVQHARGNRLRRSQWEALLSQLPGLNLRVVHAYRREDVPLPARLDAPFRGLAEDDLRTTHLGVLLVKR